MPCTTRIAGLRLAFVAVLAAALGGPPSAQALRIVNYNLTNYPAHIERNPKFRTILAPLGADIVVVQEMTSQTGVDSFRARVLNALEPGQWASAPFVNGNDTDNALFYKTAKCSLLGAWSFYPNPQTNLRLVNVYRLRVAGYTSTGAELRIYSCHLKASPGFETDRHLEAIGIRDSMNALPAGVHAILMGDFNLYNGSEPAFQEFLESQADNDGRLYDPLGLAGAGWDNNATYAGVHTQCPCLNNCPSGFGFAGGGMDSRFDMFLPTLNLNDGQGFDVVPLSYKAIGQDGQHFNKDLNVSPVIPEGQTYADALVYASDHLPVRLDLKVPAQISVASTLSFGTVVAGAAAVQALTVTNSAIAPADNLDYSLSADPGFTAPAGGFSLTPGGGAGHSITMSTLVSGARAGQLRVLSDAPDRPTANVALSGTVLDHAIASLDSAATTWTDTLDLGAHPAGAFADGVVHVHNRDWDAFQARLAVNGAEVTGGDGRFSLVGGFTPVLVAGTAQPYAVHFDDAGAAIDSAYTATLTFASADEALPGATAQPPLVVTLLARVQPPVDALATALPSRTQLYAAFPNPPSDRGTTLHFDLARAADATLDVYDVAGRRVAGLAARRFAPGTHQVVWNGRGEQGRPLAAGVYFVRLGVSGEPPQTTRVTLLR